MSAPNISRDSIDLVVTTAVLGSRRPELGEQSREVVELADRLGQALVDALGEDQTPYEWRPVAELMDFGISSAMTLQVERCRRTVLEAAQQSPDWVGSRASDFIDRLGQAIERRLKGWPTVLSSSNCEREYAGLASAPVNWDRSMGSPALDHLAHPSAL